MNLSKGSKRLTNRKRAIPVSTKRVEVKAPILPSNLPTPIFGAEPDLQKEFSGVNDDNVYGIPVSSKEKEIVSSKSLQLKRQLPVLEVTDINYTIMSHEELTKIAVFEVKNKEDAGLYSVNDPRGGTVDRDALCSTCQKDNLECPGHFGIINLNVNIIHPLMGKEILNVLNSVCGSCGSLLLPIETIRDKKILDLTGSSRLKKLAEASKKISCRKNIRKLKESESEEEEKEEREENEEEENEEEGVSACVPNPIYKLVDGKIKYTRDEKNKTFNTLSIGEIETILDSISDEDAKIMGFENNSHPRRFIMKSLAVVPLCARAPVVQDGNIWKDHLTDMYQDIFQHNNNLTKPDLKEADREKFIDNLIFSISHMINNADQKYRRLKTKPYQSIQERIQGKEALIRNALMGKRVDFSARTVIGPDPTLNFGQLRVPRVMAPYLTQHEIVTPQNIRTLTSLLKNGKITHIIPIAGRAAGKRIKVTKFHMEEHTLVLGDEVDRWLQNGDYVVFNRQPTLHKQGIMGYEVVLGDALTIGMHLGYTKQHNAD